MSSPAVHKNILVAGWLLAFAALMGTGMMVLVNWHSQPLIEKNQRDTMLRTLGSVIPAETYNNDILSDTISLVDQQYLGSKDPVTIYRARKQGKPVAAALSVIAPNGYSGDIVLLVGIDYSGRVTGVRVVRHRETPGLGDNIEIQRSNWIDGFTGRTLNNPQDNGWKVKRDGGVFDQFTGATVTPRAVVEAVHRALGFFQHNREKIFIDS